MGFTYTDAAVQEVVRAGFDPLYGARPLRRAIQKLIENPISSLIIESKVKTGDAIQADFDGTNFVFNIQKTQFVPTNEIQKKHFTCEKGHAFQTEIVPNSTVICLQCASKQVKEVIEAQVGSVPTVPPLN